MKQETRKRKEQIQEEPITLRELFGQLFPMEVVDKVLAEEEKERKQKREQKGRKE